MDGEEQRAKAIRYLKSMDDLVAAAREPESQTLRQASDVLVLASRPDGTPEERRARAESGMREIARIAEAAPTPGRAARGAGHERAAGRDRPRPRPAAEMAEPVRRHPGSAVPEIDNGLWERIRDAVLAESGAGKSLWNGRLDYTDPADPVLGEAYGDGRLALSQDDVVRPLREMFEQRGERVTEAQLVERRRAFEVVVHEFGHSWPCRRATGSADRAVDILRQDLSPIEEGSNEAWSQAKMDALIEVDGGAGAGCRGGCGAAGGGRRGARWDEWARYGEVGGA